MCATCIFVCMFVCVYYTAIRSRARVALREQITVVPYSNEYPTAQERRHALTAKGGGVVCLGEVGMEREGEPTPITLLL